MNSEQMELKLGSGVLVEVHEGSAPPMTTIAAEAQQLTDVMLEAYENQQQWRQNDFEIFAEDLVQATMQFIASVNAKRKEGGERPLSPFEGRRLLEQHGNELRGHTKRLIEYALIVRVVLPQFTDYMRSKCALVHIPRVPLRVDKTVIDETEAHFATVSVFANQDRIHIPFQELSSSLNTTPDGGAEFMIGGQTNEVCRKDGWKLPGLRSLESLSVTEKRRLLAGRRDGELTDSERQRIATLLLEFRSRRRALREKAGLNEQHYPEARLPVLDLENGRRFEAFLGGVYALVASAVMTQSRERLDQIASRNNKSISEIIAQPALCGNEADACQHHAQRFMESKQYFREVTRFVMPAMALRFSEDAIPRSLKGGGTEEWGVGPVVTAAALDLHPEPAQIVNSPLTLGRVMQYASVIEIAAQEIIDGTPVIERVTYHRSIRNSQEVDLDAMIEEKREEVCASGEHFPYKEWCKFIATIRMENPLLAVYQHSEEEVVELPWADYVARARIQLLPQILELGAGKRLFDSLHFRTEGTNVDLRLGRANKWKQQTSAPSHTVV